MDNSQTPEEKKAKQLAVAQAFVTLSQRFQPGSLAKEAAETIATKLLPS